jgi:hypothetical protein
VQTEYNMTSNHLICHSFSESGTILEAFPLPRGAAQPNDDETPSVHILTRSHKFNHHSDLGCPILLTERHELHNGNDHSARYIFISQLRPPPVEGEWCWLGFLDIFLESDSGTIVWTDAAEYDGDSSNEEIVIFDGSARAGVSRLIILNPRKTTMAAVTVSEDDDGKRVIRRRPIVVDKKLTKPEIWTDWTDFDGFDGVRICAVDSQVEFTDFV